LVPLAADPPPPPPIRVTWVEMIPVGTSRLALLYQPLEHSPVAPPTVSVYTFEAAAIVGEYTSGARATIVPRAPIVTTAPRPAVTIRRTHAFVAPAPVRRGST
jgi:hypothetical protein